MSTTGELSWFKSSYSGSEGDNCVEIAVRPGAVHVRDSKDQRIPPLTITPAAWAAFAALAADSSLNGWWPVVRRGAL